MTDTSAQRAGAAWRLHGFSGPARPVAMALFGLPRSVVDSDWYLLLLDNGHTAAAHLFTRHEDRTKVLSHEWTASRFDDLPALVVRAARESGTTARVEAVLREWCDPVTSGPSLAPISARGAFGRPVDNLRGEMLRAVVLAR